MWWFAALHRNLLWQVKRLAPKAMAGSILDAGCGTGGFLAKLAAGWPGHPAFGLDCDDEACRRSAVKSGRPVCRGSVDALPFADGSLAMIVSADVLCHRNVEEARALAEFHRCLADAGFLVLNLPAYDWLRSRHDVAVHNARRYTAAQLGARLRASGFRPIFTGYWNALLFPAMAAARKLLPDIGPVESDVRLYPRPLDALCRVATRVESSLLQAGMRFPFGGSVLAVAVKRGTDDA